MSCAILARFRFDTLAIAASTMAWRFRVRQARLAALALLFRMSVFSLRSMIASRRLESAFLKNACAFAPRSPNAAEFTRKMSMDGRRNIGFVSFGLGWIPRCTIRRPIVLSPMLSSLSRSSSTAMSSDGRMRENMRICSPSLHSGSPRSSKSRAPMPVTSKFALSINSPRGISSLSASLRSLSRTLSIAPSIQSVRKRPRSWSMRQR